MKILCAKHCTRNILLTDTKACEPSHSSMNSILLLKEIISNHNKFYFQTATVLWSYR